MKKSKGKRYRSSGLQHKLTQAADAASRRSAIAACAESAREDLGAAERLIRLRDLGSPGVDHSWLWSIHEAFGACLSPEEYRVALRARLGAPDVAPDDGAVHSAICRLCGADVDARLFFAHSTCCARAAATVGHSELKRWLFGLARACDSGAKLEVPLGELGLPSPPSAPEDASSSGGPVLTPDSDSRLVPADIFIAAASSLGGASGETCIDVGITGPFTADGFRAARNGGANDFDCVQNYSRSKHNLYADPCSRANVDFSAFVLSGFGRPSPAAVNMVEALVRTGRRRQIGVPGSSESDAIGSFWRGTSVILARRQARMYSACRPLGFGGDIADSDPPSSSSSPSSSDASAVAGRTGAAVLHGGVRQDLLLHTGSRFVAAMRGQPLPPRRIVGGASGKGAAHGS